jgi:hypothetical protein
MTVRSRRSGHIEITDVITLIGDYTSVSMMPAFRRAGRGAGMVR